MSPIVIINFASLRVSCHPFFIILDSYQIEKINQVNPINSKVPIIKNPNTKLKELDVLLIKIFLLTL